MEEQTNTVGGQAMGQTSGAFGRGGNTNNPSQHGPMPAYMQPANAGQTAPISNQQNPQVSSPNHSDSTLNQNNNVATNTTIPTVAEDSDLIEKEWVEKAKTIVEKTRHDPFLQSQGLSELRAEYLQKRYGKNLGSDGQ